MRVIDIYTWGGPNKDTAVVLATLQQATPNGPVTISTQAPDVRRALQQLRNLRTGQEVTPADGDAYLQAVLDVYRGAYQHAVERTQQ
jgi:hypothetical protein